MKKIPPLQASSRAADILFSLGSIIEDITLAIERPSLVNLMGIEDSWRYMAGKAKRARRLALHRLLERKLVEERKTAHGLFLVLTKTGIHEYLRLLIHRAEMMEGNVDCMVIFDIPERFRKLRQRLCYFLESAGFFRIQKSVYISPYDAFVPLAKLFALNGVTRWVHVYRAERVSSFRRSAET